MFINICMILAEKNAAEEHIRKSRSFCKWLRLYKHTLWHTKGYQPSQKGKVPRVPAGEEMKQRVCMEYSHSYPPSSCLPVFNTDSARAGCNDSLLGDTCAPEYLEKDQLLATAPKSFGVSSLLLQIWLSLEVIWSDYHAGARTPRWQLFSHY